MISLWPFSTQLWYDLNSEKLDVGATGRLANEQTVEFARSGDNRRGAAGQLASVQTVDVALSGESSTWRPWVVWPTCRPWSFLTQRQRNEQRHEELRQHRGRGCSSNVVAGPSLKMSPRLFSTSGEHTNDVERVGLD